ncbi:hypothetical protein TWF191_000332 [Orbilia oligospora]|uniref:Uncharacterized protein n=1 Tax=Orbilia oligospora TaxID=2813651 RepID=A0A7C8QZ92_ORBOL|nr:hypothetical protein TWF191_000332 [Orbilia oligospora]
MSLPSAAYFILGSYGNYQYSIGRAPAEDKSLNPKQVYLLRPSAVGMTPWVLLRTPRGYVFKIKDAPIGIVDDAVVAILNPNLTHYVVWDLEPVPGEQDRFREFAEEEERYSRPVDGNQRDYDSERNRDDDRQGLFGYGKREKKFCS